MPEIELPSLLPASIASMMPLSSTRQRTFFFQPSEKSGRCRSGTCLWPCFRVYCIYNLIQVGNRRPCCSPISPSPPWQDGYGLVEKAAMLLENGIIKWIGPDSCQSTALRSIAAAGFSPPASSIATPISSTAATAPPNSNSASLAPAYADIAKAGGGIMSTVRATRAASEAELARHPHRPGSNACLAEGVTTIEIKSGYGLDVETEMKMLQAWPESSARLRPVNVKTTFLGAHTFPKEFREDRQAYLKLVCRSRPFRGRQGRPRRCRGRLLRRHRLFRRRRRSRCSRPPRPSICR